MQRPANRQFRRSGGFTLLEVLVTIVLMAITLPVCMQAVDIALAASSKARHTAEAAALGKSKLDEIMAQDTTNLFGVSGDFAPEFPDYQWACQSVTDPNTGFTIVTLTVTWKERALDRSYTLSTLDNGLNAGTQ